MEGERLKAKASGRALVKRKLDGSDMATVSAYYIREDLLMVVLVADENHYFIALTLPDFLQVATARGTTHRRALKSLMEQVELLDVSEEV